MMVPWFMNIHTVKYIDENDEIQIGHWNAILLPKANGFGKDHRGSFELKGKIRNKSLRLEKERFIPGKYGPHFKAFNFLLNLACFLL